MKFLYKMICCLASLVILQSCEKIIDVDLKDTPSQIIIEAPLKVGTHDFVVSITKSTDYFGAEPQDIVENAVVILTDDNGNATNVPYVVNGQYITSVTAEAGRTYQLEVSVEGATYEATSFLPERIEIVELITDFQTAGIVDDEGYELSIRYNDPANVPNYYRVVHTLNGVLQNETSDLQVMNDDFNDGVLTKAPLLTDIFDEGDTIAIELIHFDRPSFDYFNSLVSIIGDGGAFGGGIAAPGNPNTNWSEGALGYFSAYNSDTAVVVAQ
ncbi:MAG: DUF4249 domain-containing protein [Bacteroidota bacterium]